MIQDANPKNKIVKIIVIQKCNDADHMAKLWLVSSHGRIEIVIVTVIAIRLF